MSNPFNTRYFDSPLTVSNKGIHLELRFIGVGHRGLGLAILDCTEIGKEDLLVAIYLSDLLLTMEYFERVQSEKFELVNLRDFNPSQYPIRSIFVRQGRPTRVRKLKDLGKCVVKLARIEEQGSLQGRSISTQIGSYLVGW